VWRIPQPNQGIAFCSGCDILFVTSLDPHLDRAPTCYLPSNSFAFIGLAANAQTGLCRDY
jgi:hypothetical protein